MSIYDKIVDLYKMCGSQKDVAVSVGVSDAVVHKVLISKGLIESDIAEQIERLQIGGLSNTEIAERLGVSKSCVNMNVPYRRGTYLEDDKSERAEYMRQYRRKKKTESRQVKMDRLRAERTRLRERLASIDAELAKLEKGSGEG